MAKCVYYPNVVNLASYSGSTSTLKIPCLGAKAIILTARATAGAQTVGTTVMTGFGMVQADAGFAGAAGTTHSDQIGGKNVTLNGAISIISQPHRTNTSRGGSSRSASTRRAVRSPTLLSMRSCSTRASATSSICGRKPQRRPK